jgi:hypothetical protein
LGLPTELKNPTGKPKRKFIRIFDAKKRNYCGGSFIVVLNIYSLIMAPVRQ